MWRVLVTVAVAASIVATAAASATVQTTSTSSTPPLTSPPTPEGFECAWRETAWDYAHALKPDLTAAQAGTLYDSLHRDSITGLVCNISVADRGRPARYQADAPPPPGSPVFYVAASGSSDCSDSGNDGSIGKPFCHVQRGVDACRAAVGGDSPCSVLLRGGVYYLGATIELTPADSFLTVAGYPGENATVSGATLLQPSWTPVPDQGQRKCTTYPNTDASDGGDLPGSGFVTATAEECVANCSANCKCVVGVWGSDGSDHECFIKFSGTIGTPGAKAGNTAFMCDVCTPHVWQTKLPAGMNEVTGLLVNGSRGVRARFPNANPETDKFPAGYIDVATKFYLPKDVGPSTMIHYNYTRTDFPRLFRTYEAGVGGHCSRYDPPISYWCSNMIAGGGAGNYMVPSGLGYTKELLPHTPYKDPRGAIIYSWRPGHWATWMFEVDDWNSTSLLWTKGGFQGGRGNPGGGQWFIENVREELDVPGEFFHDLKAGTLLYVGNGTTRPSGEFEANTLKTLFRVQGSQSDPVRNVTLSDLTFTGTAYTYMDPHSPPSGGDWSLQRSAALFFEGTIGCTVQNSHLIRLDGNAIMFSGFNHYGAVLHNEISYTGDTAIAGWGYTRGTDPAQPPGTGPDGTGGEFPRWTRVENNFIHHLGIHQKQSSCWFQAKTAESTVANNICFEVPRAGINLNDGFGGGNLIHDNLLFNTCGESGDHGAINTWDRQAFLTTVATGEPSLTPAYTHIFRNFVVANFAADGGCIDNDDGSSYYDEYENFCVYGGFKAGNFQGHAKKHHGNINAYSFVYGTTCFWNWPGGFPEPAFQEEYYNNTCILGQGQNYIYMSGAQYCNYTNKSSVLVEASGNTVIAPSKSSFVIGCGQNLSFVDWMNLGLDKGSTIQDAISNSAVMNLGRKLLGF
eukprot:m.481138 g.481138  ORF g.481138 m.481138 type:complete len:908 (+) comp22057_c0_seq1:176-2899(+)